MSENNNYTKFQNTVIKYLFMSATCSTILSDLKTLIPLSKMDIYLLYHCCCVHYLQEKQAFIQNQTQQETCLNNLPIFKSENKVKNIHNIYFNEKFIIKNKSQTMIHLEKCLTHDKESVDFTKQYVDILNLMKIRGSLKYNFPDLVENIKQAKEIPVDQFLFGTDNESNYFDKNKFVKNEFFNYFNCIKKAKLENNFFNSDELINKCNDELDKFMFKVFPIYCKTSFLNCLQSKQKNLESASIEDHQHCIGSFTDPSDWVCKSAVISSIRSILE
ncbi:hypothetical protein ABK040_002516 [Willaertia magna]